MIAGRGLGKVPHVRQRAPLPLATGTPLAQLGELVTDRRFDLIGSAFAIDIASAQEARDRARVGELQLTYGMHLQKMGRIRAAETALSAARRNITDPGLQAEAQLYQAKLATQRGEHLRARELYGRLQGVLRNAPTLSEADRSARVATAVWREGHSALLANDLSAARALFSHHEDLVVRDSNQAVNQQQYAQTFPAILDDMAPLHKRIDVIDRGIEATTMYPAMSLAARFTFPGVAQFQRDLLVALRCKLGGDIPGTFFHTWRICLALDEFGAGPRTESIGEVWDIVTQFAPEVTALLTTWSCRGPEGAIRLARSMARSDQALRALVAAKEDYRVTPPGPVPDWSYPRPVVRELAWERIDDAKFERLLFNIFLRIPSYVDVSWNTKTYAPDGGKDILATCWKVDERGVIARRHVAIEAKYRRANSLRSSEVGGIFLNAITSVPPADELVIATCGWITQNAQTFADLNTQRPIIELWSRSRLEFILAGMPDLVDEFDLR